MQSTYTPETIKDAKYPQFTNVKLNEGLFDQLMAAVDHHLDKQYKAQRIRGTDYAQAYVGSMQGVMQNTTQYLLGQLLIEEQGAKLTAETSLTEKNEQKIDAEIDLIELEKEKLRFEIEQLYPLQKLKVEAEIRLIDANILKVTEEINHMQAQQVLWVKQGEKIDKEIEFLTAKIVTETANVTAGIADDQSLVGRQILLLQAQKMGFGGDLYIKASKIHADYDGIYQSIQEANVGESAVLGTTASDNAGFAVAVGNAIGNLP